MVVKRSRGVAFQPVLGLLLASLILLGLAASGCRAWVTRPLPYHIVGQGSPGGVRKGYADTLLPLLWKAGGYVFTAEEDWAGLRDALNYGAGEQLYTAVDFERYVLLVYFHGPGGSMGDRIVVDSLRASAGRVQARFRLEPGFLTAVGHPYVVLAVSRTDLAPHGGGAVEMTFEFRAGRRKVVALRAPVAPPVLGNPIVTRPDVRVVGAGVPQDWAPDGGSLLVAGDGPALPGEAAQAGPGIFAVNKAGGQYSPVYVSPSERPSPGSARYSPDGSQVLLLQQVDSRLRLLVAPADGGTAPADLTPAGVDLSAPAEWSPDGLSIIIIGRETGGARHYVLLAIPAGPQGTGVVRRLFSQPAGLASPSWVAGGADGEGTVYFLRQTTQGSVLSARPASGSGQPGDLVAATRYALSPDGQWLAYIAETGPGEGSLRVLPAAALTGGGAAGNEVARGAVAAPAWSPDGKMIAYALRTPAGTAAPGTADLWLAGVDGISRQRLTSGVTTGDVRFSPDGARIAAALYPGNRMPGDPVSLVAVLDIR